MKATISFLHSVAAAYLSKYDDLSDLLFLFPNKRSGTFFLKALADTAGDRTILAPQVASISDFMATLSGREPASRVDLLFRLYNVYRRLLGAEASLSTDESLLDFDRFAPWAETALADFSEVDQQDADAQALFNNVRDYNSIASNFLTEEQLAVIERYFGYRPSSGDLESFWKTLLPEEDRTELQLKFIELWKLLPELYEGLREDLEKEGLAMPGSTFRIAKDLVLKHGRDILPWRKVVAVGFNMLSATEAKMFEEMSRLRDEDGEPYAEFFWDATGPVLDPEKGVRSVASEAVWRNIGIFPRPEWAKGFLEESDRDTLPAKITIAGAPSNAAQVKVAMMQVQEWMERDGAEAVESPGTAVVIPDENLLLPLVHSLPESLEHVNLTMGYSMRYTSAASFIYHLRRLQSRRRRTPDGYGFHHDDLQTFLAHPLVQLVAGTDATSRINNEIASNHIRIPSLHWLASRSEALATLLQPVDSKSSPSETIDYLSSVLGIVDAALARGVAAGHSVNAKIERAQLSHYQQAMTRLLDSIEANNIHIRPMGVFHLVDRLLGSETVTFEGEPLEGMQIMGVLETRALDFDRIVILSLNDKILPRRSRTRTYIPEALRRGHGLPSAAQGEELSAYYFYRLLSRANDVTLVYDARAGEGMRSGGKSRFLMQLEKLYARDKVSHKSYTFGLTTSETVYANIEKTPAIMQRLEEYKTEGSGKNMSASALMDYCECPVKFYYRDVLKINTDTDKPDYLDAPTQGTVVHSALQNLYMPRELHKHYQENHIVLTAEKLQEVLDDEEVIGREVRRAVNRAHFNLPQEQHDRPIEGSIELVLPYLESLVRNVVEYDMRHAPIELAGCEVSDKVRLKVGSAPEINVNFAIDRIDIVGGKIRIIDYKTGNPNLKIDSFDEIFSGKKDTKYFPQLMFYAEMLQKVAKGADRKLLENIELMLLKVSENDDGIEIRPTLSKPKKHVMASHAEAQEAFMQGLERVLNEIFDPEIPFSTAENDDSCKFCNLQYLCGRH